MDKHSPTPWRKSDTPNSGGGYWIEHAKGYYVGDVFRKADADFIIEAVNDYEWAIGEIHKMTVEHDELFDEVVEIRKERDRLRDIMRGLVAILDTITLEDHEIALLDEAREAIKE